MQFAMRVQARFANETGLAAMFKWPMRQVVQFGSLQLTMARECVGNGIDGRGVFSCNVLRKEHDEPLPHISPASLDVLPLLRPQ